MKKLFPILPFLALLLTACTGDPAVDAVHNTADSLMAVNRPDSALQLIHSLDSSLRFPSFGGTEGRLSHRQRMRHELLRAKAMNKAYVDFTTDSVMKLVADYYDSNGMPNERMEAHYLLGCTYRDMGEAPRAVDCFLDAVACADTTQADCDFYTLASIHAQTARLYHQQLLLSYEVEEHRKASHFHFLAKDTLHALFEKKMIAGVYILKNMKDSAEAVILNVMGLYDNSGLVQEGLQTSLMLMHLYAELPDRLSELKELIDNYDSKSSYFDKSHELHYDRKQFYFYKGVYFSKINQLDSAEYYFRKLYFPGMPLTAKNYMYDGLLRVFRNRHLADSIDKYAQLYCAVNDSSIAIKDQELTAQVAASYNYSNYQKKSAENEKKASVFKSYIIALLVAFIIGLILFGILLQRHVLMKHDKQRTIECMKAEIALLTREYEGKLKQLQQLEKSHKKRIETIQKELGYAQERNKGLQTKNEEAQEIILLLNTQFEEERNNLLLRLKEYANKVSELERQLKIAGYKKNSAPYLKLGIVTRIKEYYAKDCNKKLTEEELDLLLKATNEYFPDLIGDLNKASGISTLGIHLCVLVALNIQPNEITHLLDISSAQVGNLKKDLNNALFNENTARTLYKNLANRYKIMST